MVAYFHFTLSLVELALGRHVHIPLWSRHLFSPTRLNARQNSNQHNGLTGRGRYSKAGKKKPVQKIDSSESRTSEPLLMRPPLTEPNGPRPTYFTCRHTYESTLMTEIEYLISSKSKEQGGRTKVSSPAPGLVRLEPPSWSEISIAAEEGAVAATEYSLMDLPEYLDPVYALQTLPNCVIVSADSIKGLAQAIYNDLLGDMSQDANENDEMKTQEDARCVVLRESLRQAPRATLAIHGLVPGMFKGQKNPILERRSQTLADELATTMRKAFPAARKQLVTTQIEGDGPDDSSLAQQGSSDRWLLQILLMAPDIAAASLVKCQPIDSSIFVPMYWPNWSLPAGLAKVDITDESMPSSAYRKLMEAFELMGVRPDQSSRVYDLGACPGGWTWILRHYLDCSVTAVDRSELDIRLMKDPRIEFVPGDAFSFVPTPELLSSRPASRDVWMVSDVIAFPDRILELLERWCGQKWANYMIVTMKFHGTQPDFPALQQAMTLARHHGYHIRAKHFFNNKNEVTLMLTNANDQDRLSPRVLEPGVLGTPMYSAILPRER